MKKLISIFLFLSFIHISWACDSYIFREVGTMVVSPRSVSYESFGMIPFRGQIDAIRVDDAQGRTIVPFQIRNALITRSNGLQEDLWFDYPRNINDTGAIARLRSSRFNSVMNVELEITNRDIMPRFFIISAGRCAL